MSGGHRAGHRPALRRRRRVARAALPARPGGGRGAGAELGERAIVVAGDLLEAGVADARDAAVERFGRLDAWVSNAGVQPVAGLLEMARGEFDAVVAGNLTTTFPATRAAASRMADGGAIVNVASIEALQPAAGHSHYGAAKAAVVAHTRAAALELGPSGIRVNAVAPGADRPAGPGRRRGRTASPGGRRRARSAGSASPRTSATPACSWPRARRGGSPAPCSSSTAACWPVPRGERGGRSRRM